MKKQLFVLLVIVGLINISEAGWDIYTDTTIASGTYYTVNIYDSLDIPPVQTAVTMTGGDIEYCHVYNTAILNFESGNILDVISHNDSNITIDATTLPAGFILYNESKVHLYNGTSMTNVQIFDNAELHIYGYNLDYDEIPSPNWVTGQWENGQDFTIYLRNISSYNPSQVILHEIPEPTTLCLLALGAVLLKRKR